MEGMTESGENIEKRRFKSYGGRDGLIRNDAANTVATAGESYEYQDSSPPSYTPLPVVGARSALPEGIPVSEIPGGDEDLYILKSQIVPPVCPACPNVGEKKCEPCPPCGRCPEPAFECKKVPNYITSDDRYLPRPVLSDFSQFGM